MCWFFLCYFRPKKSSLSGWVSNPFPSCRLRSRTVALAPARLPLDFCWSADRFVTTTVFHQELTTQTMPRTALLEYSGQFMLLRRRNCCNSETTGHFVWCHHVPPKTTALPRVLHCIHEARSTSTARPLVHREHVDWCMSCACDILYVVKFFLQLAQLLPFWAQWQ